MPNLARNLTPLEPDPEREQHLLDVAAWRAEWRRNELMSADEWERECEALTGPAVEVED